MTFVRKTRSFNVDEIDALTTPPIVSDPDHYFVHLHLLECLHHTLLSFLAKTLHHRLPGIIFINILRDNFLFERHFSSFFYIHVTREKLPKQCSYKKFVCKMLMKLTIGNIFIAIN